MVTVVTVSKASTTVIRMPKGFRGKAERMKPYSPILRILDNARSGEFRGITDG